MTSPWRHQAGRPPLIGIVGGIGSGKSAIAAHFADLGCPVIDADALAKQAFEQPDIQQQIRERWGASVFSEGRIDRRSLAKIVFNDERELAALEAIVHPYVLERRRQRIAELMRRGEGAGGDAGVPAIVEDTPLLIEKGLDAECDAVVFVKVDRATQLARLAESRGWDESELVRREKSQVSLDSKAARADYVVDNCDDPRKSKAQVEQLLSRILQPPM